MTTAELDMHNATLANMQAETAKLNAETFKLQEEGAKLREEQRKLEREWRWAPLYGAVAFIGAVAALSTILVKFIH